MVDKPLLADKIDSETKLMLKYAKNNKKDLSFMESAMMVAGVYGSHYEAMRDSR